MTNALSSLCWFGNMLWAHWGRERWMSVNVFWKHTQSRVIVPINHNGKKVKPTLTSAPRGVCNLLLVANQLWFGFLAGASPTDGTRNPLEVKFIGMDFCCCWCIESVWPSRRAEGNGAVLRVNYMQSHTQFTPANLVREGADKEAHT